MAGVLGDGRRARVAEAVRSAGAVVVGVAIVAVVALLLAAVAVTLAVRRA